MLLIANNMTNVALSRIPVYDFSHIQNTNNKGINNTSGLLIASVLFVSLNTIFLRYGSK
jgi:hypothetical protein